jgi:CheY-like chemotaxis protein
MPVKLKPPTTEVAPEVPDVLIVDDDQALRESLLEILQEQGFSTIAAANGAAALQLARDRDPRLILLDLEMPVLNGWQVLEQRRRERKLRAIPVIVMSALKGDWVGAWGADAQVEKPLESSQLATIIARFLPRRAAHGHSILVVEDDEDTRAAIAEVLEDDGYRVARASNGREAELKLHEMDRPDCIIVDLWMPVMNGWSFITRLQRFGPRPIPIIVVTAADPHWGYPVPLTHVLRKPLYPEILLAMVRKMVPDTNQSMATAERPGGSVTGATGTRPVG